jgi:hypothetical protein
MSETPRKPEEREVLASLPHTRPQRRSARRPPAGAGAAGVPAKPAPKARKAKPTGAPAKARPARVQPAAATSAEQASGKPVRPLVTGPAPGGKPRRARNVGSPHPRPAARNVRPPGATTTQPRSLDPPSGAEIMGAAVQTAGELAQLGLTLGGRLLRSAASRLPRP